MPDEFVTRPEYLQGMERAHTRIDTIDKTATQIETSAKSMEKSVCEMHKIMFGSEKGDGLITKVSNLSQKVGGMIWFLCVVIVAFVGTLVSIILTGFLKR